MTPLHCAARCNTSEIILELIKNGANIYEKLDEDGESVFDIFLISNEMNKFADKFEKLKTIVKFKFYYLW